MFWFKNQNTDKQKKKPAGVSAGQALGCEGGSSKDGQNGKSQRLREEALASARAAREAIGQETLDKIAAAMTKRQQSATEQAKVQINRADPDKVLDELLYMLKNKN
ncbi:MAG: hypothetical protein LRY54_05010 [Alphaproteobacteria bacterium]|nr:hypothetical protein [Alphaproteobacteria bacterium]